MARRKTKRMKKIEPAELTFTFGIPVGGFGSVDATADLSQIASLVNRRFYRQGLNWAVAGFKVKSSQQGSIDISKLPNTWVMANSWTKGLKTWQKMNDEALEETESIRPRFLDFKIYADDLHHSQGFGSNVLPASAYGGVAALGEWVPSTVVVPFGPASPGNTAEFELVATGGNYPGAGSSGLNAVSLIEGYAASRALPHQPDPETPADADDADGSTPENWLSAIFNDGTDQVSEVIESLISDNNSPPYPFEGDGVNIDTMYPGGANQLSGLMPHDFQNFTGTTISKISYLKGGNFPCGLVRMKCTNSTDTPDVFLVQIDMVPGNHRGYMAESMLEM